MTAANIVKPTTPLLRNVSPSLVSCNLVAFTAP
jgi:hypothetical protein